MILGVDTGGTFTDFVLLHNGELTIHKVLSTPLAPEQAILKGLQDLGLFEAAAAGTLQITHGSTVATNAALEGKGAATAFITNKGFKDMLTIGRQTRPELYNLTPTPASAPIPPALCIEVPCRIDANGKVLEPLSIKAIEDIKRQLDQLKPQSVAINLLFSFLNSEDEERIEAALQDHYFVSRSSRVLPLSGEYERGIATWLNACLGPLVKDYLQRLQSRVAPSHVAVMQSSGGTIDALQAGDHAVSMLLSGPAGGLAGALFIGNCADSKHLLTFDMGGTSTDVALIDEHITLTHEGHIGRWPIATPMVDMHTIGAGGGSIAYIDAGGMLQVGPESAGASPGPACYGQGGTRPTVTDANAVLGLLLPEHFLGGSMQLDLKSARLALTTIADPMGLTVEAAAYGIVKLANEHMARALRVISIQRGYDIQAFTLCCFGGAGGLHVCALADILNLKQAIVPIHGGVLSALGMLTASKERQLSHAKRCLLNNVAEGTVDSALAALIQQGTKELLEEGVCSTQIATRCSLDLRYQGQTFTLSVPWEHEVQKAIDDFHHLHEQRYGHRLGHAVELVNVCVALNATQPPISLPSIHQEPGSPIGTAQIVGLSEPCTVFNRLDLGNLQQISGPALIVETVSTTFIAEGWVANVDLYGNLHLKK